MIHIMSVNTEHTFNIISLVCIYSIFFPSFFFSSPAGVTVAAKGYFDALVKLGELASDSQSSKELGKDSEVFTKGRQAEKREVASTV